MNKQRLALLNFYFSYDNKTKEENVEFFKDNRINVEKLNKKKEALLKKVKAKQKLLKGKEFREKMDEILSQIKSGNRTIEELGLSQSASEDIALAHNKFEGTEDDIFEDRLKEQTRLELIEKIKRGEL